MNIFKNKNLILGVTLLCTGCGPRSGTTTTTVTPVNVQGMYNYDKDFLQKHTKKVLELKDSSGQAKILLSADYQGRVMTSTATGDTGTSFGWLNYKLIESGEKKTQFNPVGGEERFWIGPEGGQYSIYFKAGDSFNIAHWQVPAIVDTVMYDVTQADNSKAVFTKTATLTNYSGTTFNIAIQRAINLLDKKSIEQKLNTAIPNTVYCVGYETDNQIKNTGTTDWKKDKGLLSIWLLGMMTPTEETKVIIPFKPLPNADSLITKNYFGDIPPERLQIKDSVLYFTCDGKYRSKIGLSPLIAKSIAASFDFKKNVLTLILFPVDKNGLYVNSKWEIQKEPFKGDVVNSYNDGPLQDGSQLGPFYEVEASSSASELEQGQTQEYRQTTCHLQGDYESLRTLAQQLLGVDLNDVRK
jgi:hypothetical protein